MGWAGVSRWCWHPPESGWWAPVAMPGDGLNGGVGSGDRITVFLADDNLIVREGVRPSSASRTTSRSSGSAEDYDELVAGADRGHPQVVVTDIRMPPTFQDEGIDGAKEVRKRHPGTGVVILSQYDDPDYAIALLEDGAAGYAYLLKDRVSDGDRLARAMREVATGGSMLDPEIVEALVTRCRVEGDLTDDEEPCWSRWPRAGRSRRSPRPGQDPRGGERRRRGVCS